MFIRPLVSVLFLRSLALAAVLVGGCGLAIQAQSFQVDIGDGSITTPQDDTLLDVRRYGALARKNMIPDELFPKLAQARGLMKSGDYINAMSVLELLFGEYPLDPRVGHLLKECYLERKLYHSAIDLLQKRISAEAASIDLFVDLADVYFKAERQDSALTALDYALGTPHNLADILKNRLALARALTLQSEHGFDTLALGAIEELREIVKDTALFADNAAAARQRGRDFGGAAREALTLMKNDTGLAHLNARAGDRIMAQLIAYPDAQAEVEKSLRELVAQEPNDTLFLKYLGEYYVKTDRFDDGFGLFMKYDSLTNNEGRQLLFYMRERFDRKSFSESRRIGEYIMRRYPDNAFATMVRFYLGRAQWGSGDLAGAIATFHEIDRTSPVLGDQLEARLMAGNVFFDGLRRYDSARARYESITNTVTGGAVYLEAQFRLWRLDLIDGNISAAEARLGKIAAANPIEDQDERLSYCLARMSLFAAARDSADAGFKRLVERFPRGVFVNDALENMMVIAATAESAPEVFASYCRTELLREQERNDSLAEALRSLADNADTTLADLALLRLGELSLRQADSSAALRAFSETMERFPESYYAPYANKRLGDMYFKDPEKREEALAIYRALLKQFGSYPFSAEVRQRLKDAGDAPAGDAPPGAKNST